MTCSTLNDKSLPLFERYRAMFALRNIGTPAAVDALASGFNDDSALFKYVPSSKPYLFLPPDILRSARNGIESDHCRRQPLVQTSPVPFRLH